MRGQRGEFRGNWRGEWRGGQRGEFRGGQRGDAFRGASRGEFRGRGRGGFNANWESARELKDEDVCGSDEEVVHLTEEENKVILETQAYVKQQMNGVLDDSQVVRVCIDEEFDYDSIRKYLKKYEMDAKYKGLDQFEWNTAITRNEKKIRTKEQIEEFKRSKQEKIRKQQEWEERQARREAYEKKKAERIAAAEKRRAERMELEAAKKEQEEKEKALVDDVIGAEDDQDEQDTPADEAEDSKKAIKHEKEQ